MRNRYASPAVNVATWSLKVHGDAVENPTEFTYDDLLQLPGRQAIRYCECFGNGRTLNWEQLGYDVQGDNWGFGDVSRASGVQAEPDRHQTPSKRLWHGGRPV